MAEVKFLDLDALLADEPQVKVVWRGQEHEVLGLTMETYLRAQQLQQLANDGGRSEAEKMASNLDFLFAMCPTLADQRAAILRLKLPKLQKLLEFVLEAAGFTTATDAAEAAAPASGEEQADDSGESAPPA